MMSNIAFLVEGHLEQRFIQRVSPNRPIRRINCNGDNVAPIAIVKRVASLCRRLNNRYYPLVVIIDREEREETSEELCISIRELLEEEGITDTIIIGVADREIENWILADKDIVMQHPNCNKPVPNNCEGMNGKSIISSCIRNYHETTIGVDLLERCRASIVKNNSPSFSHLVDQLQENDCWWLNR